MDGLKTNMLGRKIYIKEQYKKGSLNKSYEIVNVYLSESNYGRYDIMSNDGIIRVCMTAADIIVDTPYN